LEKNLSTMAPQALCTIIKSYRKIMINTSWMILRFSGGRIMEELKEIGLIL
jgi:hypothetical protein